MSRARLLYIGMLAVVGCFIVYVTYQNFIHDPQAEEFLRHKLNMKRPVPVPVWLKVMNIHLVFACAAMISGAVNLSSQWLGRNRKLHRWNGYAYLVSVLVVDLTSGYMAPYATGGKLVSVPFNILNMVWIAMTATAMVQIKRKRADKHRRWMIRSYAFCFTNMWIHLITYICSKGMGFTYTTSYSIGVYGSMLLLLAIAELIIRMTNRPPQGNPPAGLL